MPLFGSVFSIWPMTAFLDFEIQIESLSQDYRYHKLCKTFSKFKEDTMICYPNFKLDLNLSCPKGFSEPEFYGDLEYKLKKIVGCYIFSAQFIKIISNYKKIGCMQQTTC